MSFSTQLINVKFYHWPIIIGLALSRALFAQELPSCHDLSYKELRIEYAQHFRIALAGEIIRIRFPMIGKTFYLSHSIHKPCYEALSSHELGRWGLFSTTYLYPFLRLNEGERIKLFSGRHLITSPELKRRILTNELGEMGTIPNPEFLLANRISAVMLSPFFVDEQLAQKLEELNIIVVPNLDYMENHPLARLEWMLVFGHFLNASSLAEEFVGQVKTHYHSVSRGPEKKILIGHHYHGQWSMPGHEHEFVKLLKSTGGDYLFSHLSGQGSYPVSLEEIVRLGGKADIWLPQASWRNLDEALIADGRHSFLIKRKNLDIYLFKREGGGIPFYEEGYYRPDKIKEDISNIINGRADRSLHFFEKALR